MTVADRRTYRDIGRQADTLAETAALLAGISLPAAVLEGRRFLFTGCGSSYYAGSSAATLLTTLSGRCAAAAPSSEVWLLPDTYLDADTVVVGVSRTGTTTEVVRVMELAREQGLSTVALTLAAEAPVLDLATVGVSMSHVGEEGRVMTQSFSNLLFAGQWLAASVAAHAGESDGKAYVEGQHALVEALHRLLPDLDRYARRVAERGNTHYALIGSGPNSAVCSEGVLKIEEMTQIPAESVSALEYRHGPIAALDATSQLVLASCPRTVAFDAILAADALELGYRALVLAPPTLRDRFADGTEFFGLDADLPNWLYANMILAFFQYLAYHRTVTLGRDPERVRNLDKTTTPVVDPHVVSLPAGRIG